MVVPRGRDQARLVALLAVEAARRGELCPAVRLSGQVPGVQAANLNLQRCRLSDSVVLMLQLSAQSKESRRQAASLALNEY